MDANRDIPRSEDRQRSHVQTSSEVDYTTNRKKKQL